MMISKEYIVIYAHGAASNISTFVNRDSWGTDPNEEFYGYYKCEISGWKVIDQNIFIIDSFGHICNDINYSKSIFENYGRREPTIILASSNLSCWQECFENVVVLNDYDNYSNDYWFSVIKDSIRTAMSSRG